MAKKTSKKKSRPLIVTKKTFRDLNSKDPERVKGGLKPPPIPPKKPCWVARAVYGENNPRWLLFRNWLLGDAPGWLLHLYLRHGERVARSIMPHPRIKSVIRWFMDLAIERTRSADRNEQVPAWDTWR